MSPAGVGLCFEPEPEIHPIERGGTPVGRAKLESTVTGLHAGPGTMAVQRSIAVGPLAAQSILTVSCADSALAGECASQYGRGR